MFSIPGIKFSQGALEKINECFASLEKKGVDLSEMGDVECYVNSETHAMSIEFSVLKDKKVEWVQFEIGKNLWRYTKMERFH